MTRSGSRSRAPRRQVLAGVLAGIAAGHTGRSALPGGRAGTLLFTSAGRTCVIGADGTGFRVLQFDVPGQVTWQPAGFLADGRMLLLSMEPRRDGPGRPFDEYYHQTPTHLWAYDPTDGDLTELATRDRRAPFSTPQLVLPNDRLLVQVIRERPGQILSMRLDGSDARPFTTPAEGLPYGMALSPDGTRVAYHIAGPQGYQIWTSDLEGGDRIRIAADPARLCFGPAWSPDSQWLTYEACLSSTDPGHDWSDVCVSRADGSAARDLTSGQAMWFGATYGRPGARGGGSNVPAWSADGGILFPRRQPGAKVPWEYQAQRPDTDHFNRDYKPEAARGGTAICRVAPVTGRTALLTPDAEGVWDFRATPAPDGGSIAFCRAPTGGLPALWIASADGSDPRELSRGIDDAGVDHPRWWPREG
ncbi:MAG: serine/threonine protein kinase [Planctomycetia bacterium]|nr:serine/threonine protein kinase [Planctomycetia bacterium]